MEDDNRGFFDKVSKFKSTLTKTIRIVTMNTLIPYIKVSSNVLNKFDTTHI